ncbi:MAG TPA: hypothetical protein VM010_06580 [Chitinophagaceae bacterium]|nr:hypothetical protein [Chitinophagaceae bacterium]
MKQVTAVIVMLLFSIQTFSQWVWVIDYQLNKNYIAKNLCINKAKPKLHCNGKCQLSKKIAEEEKAKTSGTTAPKQAGNLVFYKAEIQPFLFSCNTVCQAWPGFYQLTPYVSPHTTIFHPPSV